MSEEVVQAVVTAPVTSIQAESLPAPAAVSSAAPAVVSPTAPVVESATAAPSPVVVAEATPATVPESAVVAPTPAPSLLGEDTVKKPDLKVVEDAKPVEAVEKPVEVTPVPVYEDFKLPEGFVHDKDKISTFTKELADLEVTTKADHAKMQAFGQKLMDQYVSEVKGVIKQMEDASKAAFEKKRTDWLEATKADPEIGGNRLDTTINKANDFIRTHGGTPDQQKEIRELMKSTGIDNHPAMIRLLAMASKNMAEGRPLTATKPVPQILSKSQKMYGKQN